MTNTDRASGGSTIRGNALSEPALWVHVRRPGQAAPALPRGMSGPACHVDLGDACVTVAHSGATVRGEDPTGRLTVFLWGETYPHRSGAELASHLLAGGDAAIGRLDGSYALVVLDREERRVVAVTDRIGTRRLFSMPGGSELFVSTTLSALPTEELPLDPAGVGWYLSNGVMHERRTPYMGVRAMRHASVHRLEPDGIASRAYWTMPEPDGDGAWDLEALEDEVVRLAARSIERRVADSPSLFVSLSGGWDSAALVSVLAGQLDSRDVRCFSYAHGPVLEGSDPWVARRVAERVGYEHRIVPSYDGDLVSHIQDNARLTEGVAPVCDEIDAWSKVGEWTQDHPRPVLFTGEARHGNNPIRDASRTRAKDPGRMKPFGRVAWLAATLPPGTYEELSEAVTADFEAVAARAAADPAGRGYYYLDQRLPNALLPWRQHFPGRYLTPRFPLLDYEMVDLMSAIPTEIRRNYLFHRAVERAFPDTFTVPRATTAGYAFDLRAEIQTHAPRLRAMIAEMPSRLDDVIPPDVLDALVCRISGEDGPWSRLRRGGHRVARGVERRVSKLMAREVEPKREISAHRVLRNLLVLRGALGGT